MKIFSVLMNWFTNHSFFFAVKNPRTTHPVPRAGEERIFKDYKVPYIVALHLCLSCLAAFIYLTQ